MLVLSVDPFLAVCQGGFVVDIAYHKSDSIMLMGEP